MSTVETRLVLDRDSADWDARMKQARARAEWELGDARWAGVILGAFLYPELDADALKAEMVA